MKCRIEKALRASLISSYSLTRLCCVTSVLLFFSSFLFFSSLFCRIWVFFVLSNVYNWVQWNDRALYTMVFFSSHLHMLCIFFLIFQCPFYLKKKEDKFHFFVIYRVWEYLAQHRLHCWSCHCLACYYTYWHDVAIENHEQLIQ